MVKIKFIIIICKILDNKVLSIWYTYNLQFMSKLSTPPTLTWCTSHIIKPANTHDLMTVTTYIKNILIHWVSQHMSDSELLNLSERRTPENILPILTRILWLQSCTSEFAQDTLYSECSVFTEKMWEVSLVSLLWSENEKYENDMDGLLRDLGAYNAYYYRKTERIRSENMSLNKIPISLQRAFQKAFSVALQWRESHHLGFVVPRISEFEVTENGIVRFSKRVNHQTMRNCWEIVIRIQNALDDILVTETSQISV